MNRVILVGLILVPIIAHADAPLAGWVTCKTTQPGAKKSEYSVLAPSCAQAQEACDQYKDDPFYGPAKATLCNDEYNLERLTGKITREFKQKKFPGTPETVTLCKTLYEGKIFAMKGESCDKDAQKKICDKYGKGIAVPTSCAEYTSNEWADNEADKHPLSSGISCQMPGSGVPIQLPVPDCSPTLQTLLCNPKVGKVLSCKQWDDPKALKDWGESIPMTGEVTCRINALPTEVAEGIPARTCTPQAQKDACGSWGTPIQCIVQDIEQLRKDQLTKQLQK